MGRFANQTAVITGGARGIGFAIAENLALEGANVALFDVSEEALADAKNTLEKRGAKVLTCKVDVTDPDRVQNAIKAVADTFGSLEILVQAAGITGATNLKTTEVDPANFDLVFRINVKGIFLCCKYALQYMEKSGYGRIVNIASISGKEGNAGMLAYSSSKAAVIGLTKVIGKEYANAGNITCNCIAPAVVQTAMVDALPAEQVKYMTDKIPMSRTGKLEEMASLACFIASPECSFTTAFCFDATGGRATY